MQNVHAIKSSLSGDYAGKNDAGKTEPFTVAAEGAAAELAKQFEAAAVAAVSQWKFAPGQKNGIAVGTHMQVPIVFTLTEN